MSAELPSLLKEAVDFVLDPVRTARTQISEIDKVEKTFIGLKIEHFFRDMIDLPKGLKRDLLVDGLEVDIKNTVHKSWMIPPETYGNSEPCILFALASKSNSCSLGLIVAKEEYLGKPNRDKKRSITAHGRKNILWLLQDQPLPPSHWVGIDMESFRLLRKTIKFGSHRAAAFFRGNLRKPIHRSVLLALLFDQLDPMKRLRENGGAPDILRTESIALVSGTYDRAIFLGLGIAPITGEEHMAIQPLNDDEAAFLRTNGLID